MAIHIAAIDLATGNITGVTATSIDAAGVIQSSTIIVGSTNSLMSDRLRLTGAGGDPGLLSAGDVYYRTDTKALKFNDSVGSRTLLHDNTSFAGDVTGTSGVMVVAKLQGDAINAAIAPNDGDVLTWDNGNSRWDAAVSVISGTVAGDLFFPDNVKALFGNTAIAPDLLIYSDGAKAIVNSTVAGMEFWVSGSQTLTLNANNTTHPTGYGLWSGNNSNDHFTFKAYDTGVAYVEVARINSAADPYFSCGPTQQFKFWYSGTASFGGTVHFSNSIKCSFGDLVTNPELQIYSTGVGNSHIVADTYLYLSAGSTNPLLLKANQVTVGLNTYFCSQDSGNAPNWQIKGYRNGAIKQMMNVQNHVSLPYISFGASNQYKFYYDGTTNFNGPITFADTQSIDTYTAVDDLFDLRAYDTVGVARLNAIRIQNSAGGTAKLGFFNAAAVVQQASAGAAADTSVWDDDGPAVVTLVNALRTALLNLGFIA